MAKMTHSDIRNRSVDLSKAAKGLGKDIHTHCMAIAKHILESSDVTLATHFVKLLRDNDKEGNSKSVVRADAIKTWFEAFGFCQWGKNKAGDDGFKLNRAAIDRMESDHWKVAARNPWNKYTPAKPFQIFDFDAALAALIKRGEDKAEETGPNGEKHKVNAEHLAKLRAVVADMGVEVK